MDNSNFTVIASLLNADKMFAPPLGSGGVTGRILGALQVDTAGNIAGHATAATLTAALLGPLAQVVTPPASWAPQVHTPAAATQATITKTAGAAGVRHVCTGIHASIACGATPQTPITVNLRDGGTGAGTVLWSQTVAAPADGTALINATGLCIVGSAATAMTLEFSGAGVAASLEAVTLTGYDTK